MAALLLLGYWLGSRVDRALEIDFPAFRIALILLALALSFYSLIKNLPRS
jgi:hypothetical protein